ncbi:MAG: sugar phosphate isomerase/epimerase family protein [Tepidanaerobacteraceae bacterium]|jgi:protein FrlC|nr:TIM barrel protein [Thermoanaerobacterales bacterium]
MKISFSTFPYLYYSLEDVIKKLSDMGYDGIEIWGGTPHAYAYDMNKEKISAIKERIQQSGIEISGFIPAQFRYPANIAIDDKVVRERSLNYLKKSIDIAVELGSPLVSICPGHTRFGQSFESAWENLVKALEELVSYSSGSIGIFIEPGNHYETDLVITAKDAKRLIKDLNSKIGVVLDTGHMFVNRESISDSVLCLDKAKTHFHIDDNMGLTDDHMIPGEGKINYQMLFHNLKKVNYNGFLTVELGFQYCTDPDPAAYRSLQYLRSQMIVNI